MIIARATGGGVSLPVVDETAIIYKTGNVAITQTHNIDAYSTARVITWQNAAGTVALLETAQTFTAAQKINVNSTTALFVEQDGVKDNVLVVDTTNDSIALLNSRFSFAENTTFTGGVLAFAGSSPTSDYTTVNASLKSETQVDSNPGAGVFARGAFFGTAIRATNTNNVQGMQVAAIADGATTFTQSDLRCLTVYDKISNANATITNLYNLYIAPRQTRAGTVGTQYGIYIDALPATTEYAIYTNGGEHRLGDNVNVVGSGDTQQLTVNGFTTQSTAVAGIFGNDNVTNAVKTVLTFGHNSSGTPLVGYGAGLLCTLKSSTTTFQNAGRLQYKWATATHATRAALGQLTVYYTTTERTVIGWGANSTAPLLGFYDIAAAPVVKPATTGTTTGFTAGGGAAVLVDSTFTGNSGTTAYTVGDVILALKQLGLLTA